MSGRPSSSNLSCTSVKQSTKKSGETVTVWAAAATLRTSSAHASDADLLSTPDRKSLREAIGVLADTDHLEEFPFDANGTCVCGHLSAVLALLAVLAFG